MMWSTNVENISSQRNSFGLSPQFCQQNKHISLKKMIIRTTCKAVDCFLKVVNVKYSVVTSHLHLHLLRWWNLYRHHTNQLARKVRRLCEGLKLYYDRFSSRNGPGIFHNSANNRESWSRKSDCVTLGKFKIPDEKTPKVLSVHFVRTLQSAVYILYLVYILYPVCSLHFVLTSIGGTNTGYFWVQLFAQHTCVWANSTFSSLSALKLFFPFVNM